MNDWTTGLVSAPPPPLKRPKITRGKHVRRDRKLTIEQANTIRTLYAAGGVSQTALAAQFEVTQALVSVLVRNLTYREEAAGGLS